MNYKIDKGILLKQDSVQLMLTKLNVCQLIEFTKADIYDSKENPTGYQRPLNSQHVKSIYEYLRTEEHSILPSSIILAIDDKFIDYSNPEKAELTSTLRIVDGQHRIEALRLIYEDIQNQDIDEDNYEDFKDWEYPVNIMILNSKNKIDKYIEIRSFVDINKKGKKVSTDLADNDLSKIRESMDELPTKEAVHQVCITVSKSMTSDLKSVWYQNMREGDVSSQSGSIGMFSFRLSISPIVRKYLINEFGKNKSYTKEHINNATESIKCSIDQYWNCICEKWEDAFLWDKQNESFRFDSDFNIQKSLGVSALHKLLNHFYNKQEKSLEKALEKACITIKHSNYTSDDWEIGKTFSPYTSSAGHNKIKDSLLGKYEIEKKQNKHNYS